MLHFDIFCRVVDNYGDSGVCWRLARQLAARPHSATVRLWVDDLHSLAKIEPVIQPQLAQQKVAQVDIRQWSDHTSFPALHQVVIEAFACELPQCVRDQISHQHLWINLEYLSAESWVDDFHGHASPQGQQQRKFFFFPGFTSKTGGLLREHNLLSHQQQWLANHNNARLLWSKLGIAPAVQNELSNHKRQQLLLFNYPNAPVDGLLSALNQSGQKFIVLSPYPLTTAQLSSGHDDVLWHQFSFVPQDEFDQLLWLSAVNIVRGEDSLLRALWAGKPMIWQPYLQDDDLHISKLEALLKTSPLTPSTHALMHAWSTGDSTDFAKQLAQQLQTPQWEIWNKEAELWRAHLLEHDDLCTRLIGFCTEPLRSR